MLCLHSPYVPLPASIVLCPDSSPHREAGGEPQGPAEVARAWAPLPGGGSAAERRWPSPVDAVRASARSAVLLKPRGCCAVAGSGAGSGAWVAAELPRGTFRCCCCRLRAATEAATSAARWNAPGSWNPVQFQAPPRQIF